MLDASKASFLCRPPPHPPGLWARREKGLEIRSFLFYLFIFVVLWLDQSALIYMLLVSKMNAAPGVCLFFFKPYFVVFVVSLPRVSFMNNQKQQKPTLSGQRFKTRKRGKCVLIIVSLPTPRITYPAVSGTQHLNQKRIETKGNLNF